MAKIIAFWKWVTAKWAAVTASRTPIVMLKPTSSVAEEPAPIIEEQPALIVEEPTPPVRPVRVKRERATTKPISMRWHFRRDILDRLDEYFDCIKRLRQYAPDDYDLLSQTGLAVPADWYVNGELQAEVERVASGPRPSFGGILFAVEGVAGVEVTSEATLYPSFLYFRKLAAPSRVQRVGGDIYALTVLYDSRGHLRRNVVRPMTCHVVVAPDGSLSLLRETLILNSRFYRKAGRRKERVDLTTKHWGYPPWVTEAARDKGYSASHWACMMLVMALRTYAEAQERTIIRVQHSGCTATFGIELSRCPRFFADRDVTALATDGRRKRIFHAVMRHVRRVDGRGIDVKPHYRGMRTFDWNGYHVRIVRPGINILRFKAPAFNKEDVKPQERAAYYDSEKTGAVIASVLDA